MVIAIKQATKITDTINVQKHIVWTPRPIHDPVDSFAIFQCPYFLLSNTYAKRTEIYNIGARVYALKDILLQSKE